ncbi:hypothetical protein [Acinetobacter higginsii]|uniref:hypothetical protein n=1 Tax=Acinetobacter higginsii TaxID=70347 RepID=UPI001F4A6D62|nr:hypothetical protein [Acinetobacter higginsii]MCH7294078.1 hypothetical protein [Acinetobacter higginsii]
MIKQTQTKMFDFSDVGLDFCAGSKNKFPEVFKKMLATGYNPQTAASISITGDQVTLTFGVNHGYVADRVLLVTATGGFNKEVYIDSVTSNTVTFTQAVTTGLTGTISTKVASLGWELSYELANIQIYKMKHIDDTFRYARFCFQNNAAHRNSIAVCIGKTFNATTGVIDDPLALQSTASVASPSAGSLPRWDGVIANNTDNNKTYSEGYSTYGKGMCVGSPYHLAFLACWGSSAPIDIYGIWPVTTHNYSALDYPVIIAKMQSTATSSNGESTYGNFYYTAGFGAAYIGNVRVTLESSNSISNYAILATSGAKAISSVLSTAIDSFNTTTAKSFEIFEHATSQHLGYCYGAYMCMYGNDATAPTISRTSIPIITTDVDFQQNVVISHSGSSNSKDRATYIAFPIEEVKLGA